MNPNILGPPPSSLKNMLILASPKLTGSLFEKSAILVTEKNSEGHEGYILNHRTKESVGELLHQAKGSILEHTPVLYGGPVQSDTLNFIAISHSENSQFSIKSNIMLEHAEHILESKEATILACVGCTAWSPNQLEDEFEQHTWFHRELPLDLISREFHLADWKHLLSEISPYHQLIANTPPSPMLN